MTFNTYMKSLLNVLTISTKNFNLKKDDLLTLVESGYTEIVVEVKPIWVWRKYVISDIQPQGNIYRTALNNTIDNEFTTLTNIAAYDDKGEFVSDVETMCKGLPIDLYCEEVSVVQAILYPMEQCDMKVLLKLQRAIRYYVLHIVFESIASSKGPYRASTALSMYTQELQKLKDDIPEFKWSTNIDYDKTGIAYSY